MTTQHFTGTLTGRSSTHAVREGTKASGLHCALGSKRGRISVRLIHENGQDIGEVWISTGPSNERLLYRGPLDKI